MDYEKTYKEFLEKLKELQKDWRSTHNMAANEVDKLLSEFEDNNDERIRKALIYHFRGDGCICTNEYRIDYKDIRAWLEKQSEHAKFRDSIQVGDKVTRNQDGVLVNLIQLNRVAKKDEKQSEKDKFIEKELEYIKGYREKGIKMLEELEKQGEQKPAEWSEEDIAIISRVISIVKWTAYSDHSHPILNDEGATELVEWLKNIKDRVQPQLEQKWSEEDEKMIESCIFCFERDLERAKSKFCESDILPDIIDGYKKKIEWLKSLSPQSTWKPSEEQMVVLNDIIINGHLSNANERILKGLQEQLKKLREE